MAKISICTVTYIFVISPLSCIYYLNTELSICDVLHLGVKVNGKKIESQVTCGECERRGSCIEKILSHHVHGAEPAVFIYLLCCVYSFFFFFFSLVFHFFFVLFVFFIICTLYLCWFLCCSKC